MSNIFKIAIASDLHCTYGGDSTKNETNPLACTYLLSDLLPRPVNKHPVESLKQVISREDLVSDIFLCPGDITDKINRQGLISGWKYLKEIKLALKAKMMAITIGNHDVDSKNHHKLGPFELIKNLDDLIPTEYAPANDFFWRNDYCIVEEENYVLLILNSCFNHTTPDLTLTTRIDEGTIEKIEKDITGRTDSEKIKIAMCHHHPMHHSNSNVAYRDYDFIDKSDKLLNMLDQQNFNLVIHGHKHDPRLVYHNASLPVLACGSFSATTNLLELGAQNTFHIIEVDQTSKKGKILTWIYSPKSGWTQKLDCYFPCHTGFGSRLDLNTLASDLNSWFVQTGKSFMNYAEVVLRFPDLDHIIPSEQIRFNEIVSSTYKLAFEPSLPNKPNRIYKI